MKPSEIEKGQDIRNSKDSERMVGYQVEELHVALAQVKSSERRLLAQYAVTRVLAESISLKDAGQEILGAIGESLGWKLGMLWNVDTQAELLRFVDLWHAPAVEASVFCEETGNSPFKAALDLLVRSGRVATRSGFLTWLETQASAVLRWQPGLVLVFMGGADFQSARVSACMA
jgi:hypothetical protein